MFSDTIAAIATASGEGSIAIIRVSGNDAIRIVEPLFRTKTPLSLVPSHTIHYGYIINSSSGETVEEVLVTVMRAPRSFTMEDVVEINSHGGTVAAQAILKLLLTSGVRLAEPGEFTKRAFLNGRIDLSQAEAVMDLIRAKSDRAFKIAMKQAKGQLSEKIRHIRSNLLQLIAHLEVNIDYPEHDTPELTEMHITDQCGVVAEQLAKMIEDAKRGKMLREGIVTAIVGRPNVGKSSLLNALVKENRAIVTDIPGTTRDIIEEYIILNGVPLKLLDTAGIRETNDLVEQIGVEKSRGAIEEADLVLLVLSNDQISFKEELQILKSVEHKCVIICINKSDLATKINLQELQLSLSNNHKIVLLSVKENKGFTELEKAIADLFFNGRIETDDLTYLSNVRHIYLLEQANQSLFEAVEATTSGMPIDIIQLDIRNSWEQLGLIIGESVGDSLLDEIFSQFCLGK
jgi:tRNA modification GTPase